MPQGVVAGVRVIEQEGVGFAQGKKRVMKCGGVRIEGREDVEEDTLRQAAHIDLGVFLGLCELFEDGGLARAGQAKEVRPDRAVLEFTKCLRTSGHDDAGSWGEEVIGCSSGII